LTLQALLSEKSESWDLFKNSNVKIGVENTLLGDVMDINRNIESIFVVKENAFIFSQPSRKDSFSQVIAYKDIPGFDLLSGLDEKEKAKPQWVDLHPNTLSNNTSVLSLVRWMRMDRMMKGSYYSGVLVVNVSSTLFAPVVESQDSAKNMLIVDAQGTIISHTDPQLIGTSIKETAYYQGIERNIEQANQEQANQEQANQENDSLNLTGTLIDEASNTFVAYGFNEATGWIGISLTDLDAVYGPINDFKIKLGLISIVVFIGVTLLTIGISLNITKAINSLKRGMKKVEQGDLTGRMKSNRQDELGELAHSFDKMLDKISVLIHDTKESSVEVDVITRKVLDTSVQNKLISHQVNEAIEHVAKGLEIQVMHVTHSRQLTVQLSEKIDGVSQSSEHVKQRARDASMWSESGKEAVTHLTQSADSLSGAMLDVWKTIEALGYSSEKIGAIVEVIKGISEETNLLSLNSSIEAARAGEAGRGFAVVATEIRKLASESSKAANEIDIIIKEIVSRIMNTQEMTQRVKYMNEDQAKQVSITANVFESIEKAIVSIESQLIGLNTSIDDMSNFRVHITEAMSTIHEVSENSSSAAEEINAASSEQAEAMAHMTAYVDSLNQITSELQEKINLFRIN